MQWRCSNSKTKISVWGKYKHYRLKSLPWFLALVIFWNYTFFNLRPIYTCAMQWNVCLCSVYRLFFVFVCLVNCVVHVDLRYSSWLHFHILENNWYALFFHKDEWRFSLIPRLFFRWLPELLRDQGNWQHFRQSVQSFQAPQKLDRLFKTLPWKALVSPYLRPRQFLPIANNTSLLNAICLSTTRVF